MIYDDIVYDSSNMFESYFGGDGTFVLRYSCSSKTVYYKILPRLVEVLPFIFQLGGQSCSFYPFTYRDKFNPNPGWGGGG